MRSKQITKNRLYTIIATIAAVLVLGGCNDIEYKYDIPQNASDCPTDMTLRSGGSGIVDRSGGSGIVDRDGDSVSSYCFKPNCPGDVYDNTVPAEISWHREAHATVVATRTCLALPAAPDESTQDGN